MFWIGQQKMEIFKLWLRNKITIFSYRASDTYWINKIKGVLSMLDDDAFLPACGEVDVQYGLFVNELMNLIIDS